MSFNSFFESRGIDLQSVQPLSGGDINEVFKVGDSVYKINRADDFLGMFERESAGLKALSRGIRTPEVIDIGQFDNYQFLELEFIKKGAESAQFWLEFGQKLAKLHQNTEKRFGFDANNYIGSLHQSNQWKDSWETFLIEERLQPMIEMAVNSGEVNYIEAKVIEGFYNRINEIYPEERPALLHGDLWGGNFICSPDGPVLIDPAVYYGHREIDLGMMHLFGGFHDDLFDSYAEVFPLENKWRSRIKINQLYPLLVHVNLFGRGYWSQVSNILAPFAQQLK